MDRVLQILVVFGLLLLLIWRSIRSREERFLRFSFLGRFRSSLEELEPMDLTLGKFGVSGEMERKQFGVPDDAAAWLWDEDGKMLLSYCIEGKLTIFRRSGGNLRELQELSVPMDCTGLAWDAKERKIYLEEAGDWFIYGEER